MAVQSKISKAYNKLRECTDPYEFIRMCYRDLNANIVSFSISKRDTNVSETIDLDFKNEGGIRVTRFINMKTNKVSAGYKSI